MVMQQKRTKLMKGAEAQNRKNLPNIYSQLYISSRTYWFEERKLLIAVYGKRDSRFTRCKASKTALDSGLQDVDSGSQVLETGFFFQWNLDSRFQSSVGIRIPELYSEFQNLGFRIPQQKGVVE